MKLLVKWMLPLMFVAVSSLTAQGQAYSELRYTGQAEQMSVGALFGGYIGAVATYNLSEKIMLDLAVAMDMDDNQNIHGWADYLWVYPRAFNFFSMDYGWYWGGGAKFRTENDIDLEEAYLVGPRGVAGLTTLFQSMAIEAFAEVAFTQFVTEASKSEMDFALGARYYF